MSPLLPASFRGVPFGVKSSDVSGGRRIVSHEFPKSEHAPFSEDMGRKGRTFSIEAFVIGDDYAIGRDALLTALEAPGPGELIHPFHGTQRVTATYRLRETWDEGRMAVFALEFALTSAELEGPTISIDGPARLTASAAALKTSAGAEFLSKFDAASHLTDAVTGALTAATAAVSDVLRVAAIGGQTVAALMSQVAELEASVSTLLDEPADLVTSLVSLVENLGAGLLGVTDALNPLAPLLALFSIDFGPRPPDDTPARLVEQVNFDATQNLVKRLVLAQASLMAIEQTFTSYDQAVATRTAIADLIDTHVGETADDVYPALAQLQTDLVLAVPGADSDLPRLVRYTPPATLPSLVLAHTLYGDLDREEDIIRRNGISNPTFITGGVELEVLTDE